jgi:hypothetical protein
MAILRTSNFRAMNGLLNFLLVLPFAVQVWACGATTKACHAATGICFNQFSNADVRSSVGIVLPPLQDVNADSTEDPFQQDVLLNVTTAFPYGFTGIGRAPKTNDVKLVGRVLANWMILTQSAQPSSVGAYSSSLITQYSEFSTVNKTHLVPATGATILFSPLSRYDDHYGSFLFRCLNCSLGITKEDFTSDGRVKLNLFRSEIVPISPAPGALNGTLPTSNLTIAPFEVHVDDLRSPDYHNYLAAANLLAWVP